MSAWKGDSWQDTKKTQTNANVVKKSTVFVMTDAWPSSLSPTARDLFDLDFLVQAPPSL